MKPSKIMMILRGFLTLSLLVVFSSLLSQEGTSKPVEFMLNFSPDEAAPDKAPPAIRILTPALDQYDVYYSETGEIELLGEVKDESKIRFVSINTDIRMVNQTGIFASTMTLSAGENLIKLKAMDEHNNMQEKHITIHYNPPLITLADRIESESRYYGLLIGIDEYVDPGIADLDNPTKDADLLGKALLELYTFDEDNLKVLKNPTRKEIISELDKLRKKVTSQDNLLIFYAGHGYWDKEAEIGYWLPSDATQESTADWFRNSALVDYIQAIPSKHTLLITDACFAGSIFKSRSVSLNNEVVYETIYDTPSRKAMTSGALTEVPDKSAFVKYLIQRLRENGETYLSSQELFGSFRNAVISNSSVLPQYGEIQNVGNQGGDFIFLKRR